MACNMFLDLSNGAKMPVLGLGTWQAKDDEAEQAIESALASGYRHIDTAAVYMNEHVLGKVLKKWISEGKIKREELFITSKVPGSGIHPDNLEKFITKSLSDLQLDYLDLYLIHFPVELDYEAFQQGKLTPVIGDLAASWKKMEEQVHLKRTKAIGLSNFNIGQIQRILDVATIKPANLQVELHTYMQQRELVDFCRKNGITVTAYSPLGSPGYNMFLSELGVEQKELPNILSDQTVKKIASKHNKTPAQILLRHLIQSGVAPIPKSGNPIRLKENINVFDFSLDNQDIDELNGLDVGPAARVCDFRAFGDAFVNHPEFPFEK